MVLYLIDHHHHFYMHFVFPINSKQIPSNYNNSNNNIFFIAIEIAVAAEDIVFQLSWDFLLHLGKTKPPTEVEALVSHTLPLRPPYPSIASSSSASSLSFFWPSAVAVVVLAAPLPATTSLAEFSSARTNFSRSPRFAASTASLLNLNCDTTGPNWPDCNALLNMPSACWNCGEEIVSRSCCFLVSSVPTSGRCSSSCAIQSGLSLSSGFSASAVIEVEKSTLPPTEVVAPEPPEAAAAPSVPRAERKLCNSLSNTLLDSEFSPPPLVGRAGVSVLPVRLVGPLRGACGVAAVWPVVGVAVAAAVDEVVVVVALGEDRDVESLGRLKERRFSFILTVHEIPRRLRFHLHTILTFRRSSLVRPSD